jgi:hypothetical protein
VPHRPLDQRSLPGSDAMPARTGLSSMYLRQVSNKQFCWTSYCSHVTISFAKPIMFDKQEDIS